MGALAKTCSDCGRQHDFNMADNTQIQTAATATTPGTKPAGAAKTSTVPPQGAANSVNSKEIDLDSSLDAELGGGRIEQPDPELDADLPKPKAKKDKQATKKPEDEEDESETDEDKALRSAVDEEEQEEETETEGEDDEANEDVLSDEELEQAMPENSDDIDPENPPKGLEDVPKTVWKRIQKQSAQIRDLKASLAEGPVVLQPSRESPLNDVNDIDTLDERVAQAREDRDWLEENPHGGMRKVNGKAVEISEEDAAAMRRESKLIIDGDATTRQRLTFREQTKPWERAQAVNPEMFVKGTQEHTFMVNVLKQCPQITQLIPDWEYLLATAARGTKQVIEERSGKFKYVRFEVDANGKLLPLKSKPSPGGGTAKAGAETAKPKPKAPPPASPSSQRPPIARRPNGGAPPTKQPARMPVGDGDLGVLLANELR